jgi:hypothetical protein
MMVAKSVNIGEDVIGPMCDCEELEMEDFESMIAALSKKLPTEQVEEPLQAPVPLVAAKRKK